LFGQQNVQPLNGISMENAELTATGAGRRRDALLARYKQLEDQHFPSEDVNKYQEAVRQYVSGLDQVIDMFMKKGSSEWPGVKELRRLRDAADNSDRSKLMR
jgi:nitrate/nitrite-specific signal transduction histidine kinase